MEKQKELRTRQRAPLLREALLVADHNAYTLGQIMFLKKALGEHAKDAKDAK